MLRDIDGKVRILLQGLEAHERLDRLAAPWGLDKTDRKTGAFLDLGTEVVGDSRETVRPPSMTNQDLRCADLPMPDQGVVCIVGIVARRNSVEWSEREGLLNHEQAKHRSVGLGDVLSGFCGAVDAVLHVALPGTDPDITDKDVGEGESIASRDRHGHRILGGLQRLKIDPPLAVGTGDCTPCARPDSNRHFFSGAGFSPDGQCGRLLKHHVVAENRRHRDAGASGIEAEDQYCAKQEELQVGFHQSFLKMMCLFSLQLIPRALKRG